MGFFEAAARRSKRGYRGKSVSYTHLDVYKRQVRGNPAYQTGRAIVVEKVNSKIRGRFTIISDEHAWTGSDYQTTLGLRFLEVA